jgi:hypothetical protein
MNMLFPGVSQKHMLIRKTVEEGSLVSSDTITIDTETKVFRVDDRIITLENASDAYPDKSTHHPSGYERCRNGALGMIVMCSGMCFSYLVEHEDGKILSYVSSQLYLVIS